MNNTTQHRSEEHRFGISKTSLAGILSVLTIGTAIFGSGLLGDAARAGEPTKGDTKRLDLGGSVTLEVVFAPRASS